MIKYVYLYFVDLGFGSRTNCNVNVVCDLPAFDDQFKIGTYNLC